MDASVAWWVLAVALIGVGLAGTVLPALPGTALIFGGILLGAWIDDFQRVGPWPLVAVGVALLAAAMPAIGAYRQDVQTLLSPR